MLSSGTGEASDDDFNQKTSVSFNPFSLSNTSYTPSTTPYILMAPSVTITKSGSTSINGQMYYVMGAKDMIFSTSTNNGLFVMNENPLDKMLETQSNQDH